MVNETALKQYEYKEYGWQYLLHNRRNKSYQTVGIGKRIKNKPIVSIHMDIPDTLFWVPV